MDAVTEQAMTDAMTEILLDCAPDAQLVPKYGGMLIEAVAGDPSTQVAGYFFYAHHMSLEFTHGAALDDPDGVLEGKGKYRRHIKASSVDMIAQKNCAGMLKQAISRLPD